MPAKPTPPPTARAPLPDPWPLLLALLASVAALQIWLAHDLQWLPSPIFGGDYAYQLGCIRSILASRNPLTGCSLAGALPGYLPLYGTLVAGFAAVSGLDALPAMIVLAVVFRVLSVFVVYRVIARLFGKPAAFATACLWAALHPDPVFKYTDFTSAIVVPLYFLALIRYLDRPSAARAAWLGLALATLGYSHAVAFIGGVAIAGIAVALGWGWRLGPRGFARELRQGLLHAPILVGLAALSLGYWYKPIFVYHGHPSLHYAEWAGGVIFTTFADRLSWARQTLLAEFSFDSAVLGALTLLILAGLACFALDKTRQPFAPAMLATAATFLWMFHYFVTVPVLHTHFVPLYVQWMLWGFARMLPVALAFAALFALLRRAPQQRIVHALALLLALAVLVPRTRELRDGPDMKMARAPLDPAFTSVREFADAHLAPDAVVLTTNELGFGWSVATGRKTVVTRRGQNDAFLDMDVRNRDAALMLYGADDTLRTRLLDQYRVGHVFWMSYWFDSEYKVSATGDTLAFDPPFYFANAKYDDQLAAAGVNFYHDYTWVDPTLRGPEYPRFDLTLLTPRNYRGPHQPWCDDLQRRLEPVWRYPATGVPQAVLYRVRPPARAAGR